jgi:hypothetical protein
MNGNTKWNRRFQRIYGPNADISFVYGSKDPIQNLCVLGQSKMVGLVEHDSDFHGLLRFRGSCLGKNKTSSRNIE